MRGHAPPDKGRWPGPAALRPRSWRLFRPLRNRPVRRPELWPRLLGHCEFQFLFACWCRLQTQGRGCTFELTRISAEACLVLLAHRFTSPRPATPTTATVAARTRTAITGEFFFLFLQPQKSLAVTKVVSRAILIRPQAYHGFSGGNVRCKQSWFGSRLLCHDRVSAGVSSDALFCGFPPKQAAVSPS